MTTNTNTITDINHLEKLLIKRELEKLTKELQQVGDQMNKIFSRYDKIPITGPKRTELFTEWLQSIVLVRVKYFSGYQAVPTIETNAMAPEELEKAISKYAAEQFMEQVEGMQHIIEELQQNG